MIVLITGVSTGLGRAFAQALLEAGHTVIGTVRDTNAVQAFEQLAPGRAFARRLDVTDEQKVPQTVAKIESSVGPIDALINNAGYGHEGTLEESPLQELRHQFDVNVFGAVAMIKAVLPFMRQRRRGRILNITSMGGLMATPGLSFYHGSKFALEGISASLRKELKGFGIHVTAVEPGMFRTDWAGRSLHRSERHIADYDALFDPIRAARAARSGKQQGDPARAGRVIVQLLEAADPPAHLLLGKDAFENVTKELSSLRDEFAEWENVTCSTSFDE